MNKTLPSEHLEHERAARYTLANIAAAMVTCPHPEENEVSIPSLVEPARVSWCCACGALYASCGEAFQRFQPMLPSLLTKKRFDDVVLLLHAIRQLTQLVGSQPCPGAPGSPAHTLFRTLRGSLQELSRMRLVRGLDELEAAVAKVPAPTCH